MDKIRIFVKKKCLFFCCSEFFSSFFAVELCYGRMCSRVSPLLLLELSSVCVLELNLSFCVCVFQLKGLFAMNVSSLVCMCVCVLNDFLYEFRFTSLKYSFVK